MKRTRIDEDFNPVYPYDSTVTPTIPFIAPPFVSANGLQENPPGILSLNYADPLTTNNGKLSMKLGSNLSLNSNGALTCSTPVTEPLTNNGTLGLAFSPPLNTTSARLGISLLPPITVTSNALSLSLGNGLTTSNSSLTVKTTGAINFNSQGYLQLRTAGGMRIDNSNTLILDVDYPFDAANQLRLRLGKGMYLENGRDLSVKLGNGLSFDSSGRIAASATARSRTMDHPSSISTWPQPLQANCTVFEPLDATLGLELIKIGSHVLGAVTLKGVKGQLCNMQTNTVTIKLTFNANGHLLKCPLVSSYWQSETVEFMPNRIIYPPQSAAAELSPNSQPHAFSVAYNTEPSGFSFLFNWSAVVGQPFNAPAAMFCYVAEQ
ncbi:IV-1 [Simian mastadenovirus C]|uniref:IV-1 n=1 Tax=Simian mastadenovirus C TaxID=1962300 RepID=M9Z2Q1_9ADEN|nr:IV-1 [Simian mastadenovirus C]